jgi:hypothetical protein
MQDVRLVSVIIATGDNARKAQEGGRGASE